MTDNEKKEIISNVVSEIKKQSVQIENVPTVDSLDGLTSIPAVNDENRIVKAPISVLSKASDDAAAHAEEVTQSALKAVEEAKTAKEDAEVATAAANEAAQKANNGAKGVNDAVQAAQEATAAAQQATEAAKTQTEACNAETLSAKEATENAAKASKEATIAAANAMRYAQEAQGATSEAYNAIRKAQGDTQEAIGDMKKETSSKMQEVDNAIKTANEKVDAAIGTMTSRTDEAIVASNDAKKASEEATTATNEATAKAQKATEEAQNATAQAQKAAEDLVGFLTLNRGEGFVEAYEEEQLNPEPIATYGNRDFLKRWQPVLVDMTDNTRMTTKPVGVLKKNNLLRFKDGRFAPTVGITEEQRAQCDAELYLDAAHTQKYCDAGAFDAEAFWNEYKDTQKLYTADGTEIEHILRPWETTSKDYSVFQAYLDQADKPAPLWLIDNVKGESGKVWKGLITENCPKAWDGIDVSRWKLAPTGISPCPVTTVDNKTRTFFYLYQGTDPYTMGRKGQSDLCDAFYNIGRTFPRATDIHQVNNADMARANNADSSKPYPFAEGGYHAWNTFISAMECLHGTKDLHSAQKFTSGISSNDACSNESQWQTNGGGRYRVKGTEAWKYVTLGSTTDMCYNKTGSKGSVTRMVNSYTAKEQCMESQMAASYAAETGIAENTDFTFYGDTYRYRNVPGGVALLDGGMDVVVYKVVRADFDAYNAAGEDASWQVEVNLRMSLMSGVNHSGDIFAYWGGGCEMVETNLQYTSSSGQQGGNPIKAYIEPDQTRWMYESLATKDNLGRFDFEDIYELMGEGDNISSYTKVRLGYTPMLLVGGGYILHTGEAYYYNAQNYKSSKINQRVRCGLRFRGVSYIGYCSARYLVANYAVRATTSDYGGSALCLLE